MAFTGNENHEISLSEAASMTKKYRDQMGAGDRKGGFFGRDAIERILAQHECVGIRFYYGLDVDEKQVLVLTGTKADEDDLYNRFLAELSIPCPNYCGADNPLNSD